MTAVPIPPSVVLPCLVQPPLPQTIPSTLSFTMGPLYTFLDLILPLLLLLFLDFIYLFLERGEGREKERERNIRVWLRLSYTPYWGPGLQPRHVPTGNRTTTVWFAVRCSIH